MARARSQSPADDALLAGLRAAAADRLGAEPVFLVQRLRNIQTSTWTSEIVTCRLMDGRDVQVFCKYLDVSTDHHHEHPGGVALEAEVYRDLLSRIPLSTPRYYGHFTPAGTGSVWLFTEALDATARINKSSNRQALPRAAEWVGRFHSVCEPLAADLRDRVQVYDAAYYTRWVDRTWAFAKQWQDDYPWLAALCRRFRTDIPARLLHPTTIIHGEYYPKNVLIQDGLIYPIDWESAAVAIGEIDIASLVEQWPPESVRQCEAAYCAARWPDGAPGDFQEKVDLARMYLHFRWIHHRPKPETLHKRRARLVQLHDLASRWNLL